MREEEKQDELAQEGEAPEAPPEETPYGEGAAPQEEKPKKKKRKRRKDMTPEEKKRRTKRDLIITGCVFGLIALFASICAIVSYVGYTGNFDYIDTLKTVSEETGCASSFTLIDADESQTGYYEFVASSPDDKFNILHLTDIHLGAGPFSAQKDRWAIDAVDTVVKRTAEEGLDLVVVTGDLGFPVPYSAGTINNLREIEMFGTLMAKLDVYWTVVFGNHDTEIYSLYDREDISNYFTEKAESGEWDKFLYRRGDEELSGYGNEIIVVRHPNEEKTKITAENYEESVENSHITQALALFDSHSYTDGDYFGIAWKYDNIKQDQIDWYAGEMDRLTELNGGARVKNLLFFHIPLREYGKYWEEYRAAGSEDTETVKYVFGVAGESGEKSFPGMHEDLVLETAIVHGGQGIFCGHDHYNNYALDVTVTDVEDAQGNKGSGAIRLQYGMSIDYIAYPGISSDIEQRGCAEIRIYPDGGFATRQRPLMEEEKMEFVPFPKV